MLEANKSIHAIAKALGKTRNASAKRFSAGKLNNCFSVVDALLLAGVYALRGLRTVSSRANIERGMTTGKRR